MFSNVPPTLLASKSSETSYTRSRLLPERLHKHHHLLMLFRRPSCPTLMRQNYCAYFPHILRARLGLTSTLASIPRLIAVLRRVGSEVADLPLKTTTEGPLVSIQRITYEEAINFTKNLRSVSKTDLVVFEYSASWQSLKLS